MIVFPFIYFAMLDTRVFWLVVLAWIAWAGFLSEDDVIDGRAKVDPKAVRGAARTAIDLVAHGHRDLVFHPRCGTSAAVAILFTALACVVFGMVGLFLHVEPETLLANYAVVLLVLVLGARRMGRQADQRIGGGEN